MDPTEDAHTAPSGARRDRWQLAAAAILEGLPDAVVAAARDGRIVFVTALAEKLFGYSREELLGQPVQTLWPERVRERYTGNMELYFESEHPLRFSNEAWGLRGDGSEFVGEMSWGVVETTTGPLLLAIGREISDRRTAEAYGDVANATVSFLKAALAQKATRAGIDRALSHLGPTLAVTKQSR